MIVRIPIAPTNSEIPAIAVTAAVMMPMIRPKVSSISVCVVIVKSSSPRWRVVSTALTRVDDAGDRLGAAGDARRSPSARSG